MAGKICPVRQDVNQSERLRRPCSYPTSLFAMEKVVSEERSRLLELIGSIVVAASADYTRYL
jgi:hypothetical protein